MSIRDFFGSACAALGLYAKKATVKPHPATKTSCASKPEVKAACNPTNKDDAQAKVICSTSGLEDADKSTAEQHPAARCSNMHESETAKEAQDKSNTNPAIQVGSLTIRDQLYAARFLRELGASTNEVACVLDISHEQALSLCISSFDLDLQSKSKSNQDHADDAKQCLKVCCMEAQTRKALLTLLLLPTDKLSQTALEFIGRFVSEKHPYSASTAPENEKTNSHIENPSKQTKATKSTVEATSDKSEQPPAPQPERAAEQTTPKSMPKTARNDSHQDDVPTTDLTLPIREYRRVSEEKKAKDGALKQRSMLLARAQKTVDGWMNACNTTCNIVLLLYLLGAHENEIKSCLHTEDAEYKKLLHTAIMSHAETKLVMRSEAKAGEDELNIPMLTQLVREEKTIHPALVGCLLTDLEKRQARTLILYPSSKPSNEALYKYVNNLTLREISLYPVISSEKPQICTNPADSKLLKEINAEQKAAAEHDAKAKSEPTPPRPAASSSVAARARAAAPWRAATSINASSSTRSATKDAASKTRSKRVIGITCSTWLNTLDKKDPLAAAGVRGELEHSSAQELAKQKGVTLSELRCATRVAWRKHPQLAEDLYVGLYEKYRLPNEAFREISQIADPLSYKYVQYSASLAGVRPIDRALNDPDLPSILKRYIAEYLQVDASATALRVATRNTPRSPCQASRNTQTSKVARDLQTLMAENEKSSPYAVMSTLRARYTELGDGRKGSDITMAELRDAGYKTVARQTLVIRSDRTFIEVIRQILDDKKMFRYGDPLLGEKLCATQAFASELKRQLANLELIEYQKDLFLKTSALSSVSNITLNQLKSYREHVCNWIPFNVPFTIRSLEKAGFSHPAQQLKEDLGADDVLFERLIDGYGNRCVTAPISSIKFCNKRVFVKQDDRWMTYTKGDFLSYVIAQHNGIELEDLMDVLRSEYGMEPKKLNLRLSLTQAAAAGHIFYNEQLSTAFTTKEAYATWASELLSNRK